MFTLARRLTSPLTRMGVIASMLIVAACEPISVGKSGPASGPLIDPSQPVPVALLVPGGTGNADLDWLGRSLGNAAKMAASDAQGARIDLRIYQTSVADASSAAKAAEAIDAGAKIIIGPLFASATNEVGNIAKSNNINVLSFSNNADVAGGNVFVLGNTFGNVANRLVSYGTANGKKRIMIVAEDDVAGQVGAQAIETAIARNGATLVGKATHPVSKSGIEGIVPQVAAAAKSGKVDAVFVTANQQAVLPYLTDQLRANGVTPGVAQLMGLTRWDVPAARLELPGVQGGWFALPDTRLQAQFESRYRAAYGEKPHDLAALAYDGVAAISALVRAGNKNALTTAGLTKSAGFSGVNGVFRLRPDGTNERGLAIATIRNKQVIVLDPAPRSFGGFGF